MPSPLKKSRTVPQSSQQILKGCPKTSKHSIKTNRVVSGIIVASVHRNYVKRLAKDSYTHHHTKSGLVFLLYAYISWQTVQIHQVGLELVLQKGCCVGLVVFVCSCIFEFACSAVRLETMG